jgi:hypothetical protein
MVHNLCIEDESGSEKGEMEKCDYVICNGENC